jgi:hypothetical protein
LRHFFLALTIIYVHHIKMSAVELQLLAMSQQCMNPMARLLRLVY